VWSHEETTVCVAKHTFHGADVVGAQKIFSNRLCRTVNCASCCTAFHGSPERPVLCCMTYEAQVVLLLFIEALVWLLWQLLDLSSKTKWWSLVMVIRARDYLRFSIQGQKQRLLDYFARPRPRTRTPLAGFEDARGQGRDVEDSISACYGYTFVQLSDKVQKLPITLIANSTVCGSSDLRRRPST